MSIFKTLGYAWACILVGIVPLAALGQVDELRYDDWSRMDGDRYFMKFRGQVFHADGSAAEGCTIRGYTRESGGIELKSSNSKFELEVESKPGWSRGIFVRAESGDGQMIGYKRIGMVEARHFAVRGIRVELEETRPFRAQVIYDGQPLVGANVRMEVSFGPDIVGVSDVTGWFETRIPETGEVHRIIAWHEDKRIGGYSFRRAPARDQTEPEHVVEVFPCRNQKVKVLDDEGNPVPDLVVELKVATPPPFNNFVDRDGMNVFTTDSNGEFVDPWFPDWEKVRRTVDLPDSTWYETSESVFDDDILVVQVARTKSLERRKVTGKLKVGSKMLGGFWIELCSFQHPEEHRMDKVWARTDDEGNFSAELMHGSTYCVYVNDLDWISSFWTGVAVNPDTGAITSPDIKLSRGPKVEIVLTQGPDHLPVVNGQINIGADYKFTWMEGGVPKSGSLGPDKWVTTNEEGIALTRMPVGPIEAHVRVPGWVASNETKAKTGETTRIEFHRKFPDKRKVAGRLLTPEGIEVDLQGAEVVLFAIDNETRSDAKTIADSNGAFECEIAGGSFAVFAKTNDARFAVSVVAQEPDSGIEIALLPTYSYNGKLVDIDGNPIANKKVGVISRLQNENRPVGPTSIPFSLQVSSLETTTDADGKFSFDGIPLGMKTYLGDMTRINQTRSIAKMEFESKEDVPEFNRIVFDDKARR